MKDWISVNIDNWEMPEENEPVWLRATQDNGNVHVFIGSWGSDFDGWWWNYATSPPTWCDKYGWEFDPEMDDLGQVTHWMPLPKPPKE